MQKNIIIEILQISKKKKNKAGGVWRETYDLFGNNKCHTIKVFTRSRISKRPNMYFNPN